MAANTAILNLGADVSWADIDPATGCMDVQTVSSRITRRTKAVMFVDWAGVPADINGLTELTTARDISLIEDAAHSFGATYRGRKVGNHCDFVCFSFQAIKHLTTVDGGAISCTEPSMYARARLLRWYGLDRLAPRTSLEWPGDVREAGYKMHLNDVLAAIGLEQLEEVDHIISCHRRNAARLMASLSGVQGIQPPKVDEGSEPTFWVLPLRFSSPALRRAVSQALTAASIQNSIVHRRNDTYSIFARYRRELPGVSEYSETALCIPCGWWMTSPDLTAVETAIKEAATAFFRDN
jgi:dTDP-4-amino-4,6-dideoxygalactose transaminase